ncbi:capZ-interacting protein isoform X2 [Hemicordylus capensis]|uniref:capZ-interacting protein isoform X2 n=1 Tax=Hemicordylus capensis TaxID=884348 RepID=UPI002302B574|nr:capZ-interacting protein isoform X2 [Hemicordylus capensis]
MEEKVKERGLPYGRGQVSCAFNRCTEERISAGACNLSFPSITSCTAEIKDRPSETNTMVEKSASPSVAQLAVKFKDQLSHSGKEIPVNKPVRRKPPCSLPLKPDLGQNGELKRSPNASHPPRVKVKSSPMIEKLQANLAFAPAALLPGASPKSPGLKVMASPFHSPPSTPISPQAQSQSSESEETPASFDQPPEGTHLQFYNKVRTRGSIKRRPPSRRFRKSQSEFGDDQDIGAISPQENGAKDEEDSAFTDKTVKSISPTVDGVDHQEKENQITADGKTPSDHGTRGTESKEREMGTEEMTICKDSKEEKSQQNVSEEKSCKNIKEGKERNPDHNTADTEEKSTLGGKEDGDASDQKDKEERTARLSESEDTEPVSDTQDMGTSPPAGDTETDVSSRV